MSEAFDIYIKKALEAGTAEILRREINIAIKAERQRCIEEKPIQYTNEEYAFISNQIYEDGRQQGIRDERRAKEQP